MRRRNGFTLIEALLAISLLAMGITAITVPFTAVAQNEVEDASQCLAGTLASEMMEEILSKPFDDPQGDSVAGPEVGESNRGNFDNMDDYHGYVEAAGSITDAFGSVVSDPAAYNLSRHVDVDYVWVSGQDTEATPTFLRITIEMQQSDQPLLHVTRLVYAGW